MRATGHKREVVRRHTDALLALNSAPIDAQMTGQRLHILIFLQVTRHKRQASAAPRTRVVEDAPQGAL